MKKIVFLLFIFLGVLFAKININTASIEELKTLNGIGEKIFQNIKDSISVN